MTKRRSTYHIDYESDFERQVQAASLPAPVLEYRFHPTRRWRFDLAWPDHMLAAEIDGGVWTRGRHTRGVGYQRDCTKLNEAVLLGWRVLRFTPDMIRDGQALKYVEFALDRT